MPLDILNDVFLLYFSLKASERPIKGLPTLYVNFSQGALLQNLRGVQKVPPPYRFIVQQDPSRVLTSPFTPSTPYNLGIFRTVVRSALVKS